jgi:hypothetical protein
MLCEGAMLAIFVSEGAPVLLWVLDFVLPGEVPGCVSTGALSAPVGAGAVLLGEDMALPELIAPCVLPVGPEVPGDMPGLVSVGVLGELVGAGAAVCVCAAAKPAETIKAAEASKIERMEDFL